MVLLQSKSLPLGSDLPEMTLPDAQGTAVKLHDCFGPQGLILVITCNHCPYVLAVWERFVQLAHEAMDWGMGVVAVNPNIHPDYPADAPEKMPAFAQKWGMKFQYLVDQTQDLARALDAQCTPDIYVYDAQRKLAYHGRIDDNWKDPQAVTQEELRAALECLRRGQEVLAEQHPTLGCSIKWRSPSI